MFKMKKKEGGFSLIEILIVLGLIASLAFITSTRPSNSQKDYRRFFRRFSLLSKRIRNQALAENATFRIVFLLDPEKSSQVWVEKSKGTHLLGSEKESREEFKEMLEDLTSKDKKEEKKRKSTFNRASRFDFNSLKMPTSLKINQIEISGIEYSISDGLIAFHYFPHGLVEETAIQFSDLSGDYKATLITDSISGEIYYISGHKSLEELQRR